MKKFTLFALIAILAAFIVLGCGTTGGASGGAAPSGRRTPTLDQQNFYGTFSIANGNRTMIISRNSFTYLFPNGSPPTDVTSKITSWKQVPWTVQHGTPTGVPVDSTITAWEIECQVEKVKSQTIGNQMNAFFGVSGDEPALTPGHTFTVWLLCNDPAILASPSSVTSGGINVGFINDQGKRAAPWPNFYLQGAGAQADDDD